MRLPGGRERELSVQRLNERLVAVEIFFVVHDEIDIRIAGRRRRPFDLACLVVRRDRDRDLGVVGGRRPVAVEQRARPVVAFARRRDEQGVVDGAGGAVGHGAEKAGLRPRGAGDEGEGEKHDRQNGKRSFQRPRRALKARRPSAPRDYPPLAPAHARRQCLTIPGLPRRILKARRLELKTKIRLRLVFLDVSGFQVTADGAFADRPDGALQRQRPSRNFAFRKAWIRVSPRDGRES